MAIEELVAVVPPPSAPLHPGPIGRRSQIEQSLGVALPDDLYELALRYGSGRFGEIEVFNPFAPTYLERVEMVASCYRGLKEAEGNDFIPYEIFPRSPGFLPWGDSWSGDCFFWLTDGEPNRWPIALVVGRQADVFETLPMRMTTFLARVFSGGMACVLWDTQWQIENLVGQPFVPA